MTSVWNRRIFFPALFLLSTVISFFLFYLITRKPFDSLTLAQGEPANPLTHNPPHFAKASRGKQPIYPSVAFGEGGQPTTYHIPQLSLESIFSSDHTFLAAQLPPDHLRTLIATGDVIPARSVNSQTVRRKNFLWPWEKTADFLKNADVTFINLETPLIKNCLITDSGMTFCGGTRHIEGLKYAGIDIVNLANNHAGNWGQKGIEETVSLLNNAGIKATGINNTETIDVKGLRFAFLGFHELEHNNDFSSWKEKVAGQIKEAKKIADVIIVAFHWGWEYTDRPNQRQIELAHLAIDNGADLIIGNHPHWIQPVEIYKEKLIVYAHGNFIFDQMWSEKTKEGIVGRYTFYDNQLIDAEFFPVYIKDYGQPSFLEGERKEKILEELEKTSSELKE